MGRTRVWVATVAWRGEAPARATSRHPEGATTQRHRRGRKRRGRSRRAVGSAGGADLEPSDGYRRQLAFVRPIEGLQLMAIQQANVVDLRDVAHRGEVEAAEGGAIA